ncbi:MAG: carboxymuconolactone decarboxylase family protein [Pseudorhodoplanes sp.]|uniref:carboxymuconolactone decarboxylase family protein n=1 Tax=Pseudorhodoplanes sp. TaxID=1934341 RepID=UPI003D0C5D73
MARIAPIDSAVTPELQAAFEGYKKILGFVPNSVLIMQRRPQMVFALGQLIGAAWAPDSTVDAGFKRLVAYMASHAAGCQYCVAHQVSGALHLNVSEAKLAAIWEYENSPLYSEKERVALEYARAAGTVPNAVSDELFDRLKSHWSEEQIVELTGVIAVFGFLNRFNDSLATPLEPEAIGDANRVLGRAHWSPGKHAT